MTDPRTLASLLWGLVGALSFLVLVQGYELVADPGVEIGVKVGLALAVGLAAASLAYAGERWLAGRPGE